MKGVVLLLIGFPWFFKTHDTYAIKLTHIPANCKKTHNAEQAPLTAEPPFGNRQQVTIEFMSLFEGNGATHPRKQTASIH